MATLSVNERARKYRASLRDAGLRPLQIWVPDTRAPGFGARAAAQARAVALADQKDAAMNQSLDQALSETQGWTE